MSEEQTTPTEVTTPQPPADNTQVSQNEIQALSKEIEAKDNEKISQLRDELSKQSEEKANLAKEQNRKELQVEFAAKLADHIKQLDESYEKKFGDVNQKIEELTPRKGMVDTSNQNPYQELKKETPAAQPQEDYSLKALHGNRQKDMEAANAFLDSFKNK